MAGEYPYSMLASFNRFLRSTTTTMMSGTIVLYLYGSTPEVVVLVVFRCTVHTLKQQVVTCLRFFEVYFKK